MHISARPVGVFWMKDEAGPDAKVLCVPATDPRWQEVTELEDVPEHLLAEIRHFFEIYKTLEPGKDSDVRDWDDRDVAERVVVEARERFLVTDRDGQPRAYWRRRSWSSLSVSSMASARRPPSRATFSAYPLLPEGGGRW